MELLSIRGGNRTSLENREYNICVGISLGNKWFTAGRIVDLIEWSLEYTKDCVVICPADDIHAINLKVRSRKSTSKSFELARKMSADLIASVKEEVDDRLSEEQKTKIIYAGWSDVADEQYQKKVRYLYKKYEEDSDFRTEILNIVREATSKERQEFSEESINILGTYVLEELPEVIARVPIKGVVCDAYVYPFDSSVTEFVEHIQKGDRFRDVRREIMDTESKVFLEVR